MQTRSDGHLWARIVCGVLLSAIWLTGPVAASDSPRLVVILVIDQFRADYIDTYGQQWTHGSARSRAPDMRRSRPVVFQRPTG